MSTSYRELLIPSRRSTGLNIWCSRSSPEWANSHGGMRMPRWNAATTRAAVAQTYHCGSKLPRILEETDNPSALFSDAASS